jgi:hypothetical protein
LKHHVEPSNAGELLALISGVSVRLAKERLAARFPLPPVAESVRKLSAAAPIEADRDASLSAKRLPGEQSVVIPHARREQLEEYPPPRKPPFAPASTNWVPSSPAIPPSSRSVLVPLAEDRFLIKVTLTRAARDKLELARDLMRHRHPDGRLDAVLEAALDALLDRLERKKFGRAEHPHEAPRAEKGDKTSRTVPRASRRSATRRDGIQCAFVSTDGHRCEARAFLEFDHVTPLGKGGGPESDNIRVLCRAHNRMAAELAYGRDHVEAAIAEAQRGRLERRGAKPQRSGNP